MGVHLLGSLVKSLRSDFKYMKDAELIEIMRVTKPELRYMADVLEVEAPSEAELVVAIHGISLAAEALELENAGQLARSRADAAAVAAEHTAVAAAEASEEERLALGKAAHDRARESQEATQRPTGTTKQSVI